MSAKIAIFIAREPPRQPEVMALIAELDRLMASLYPAESNHLLDITALEQPDVRFMVARREGAAIGCGAYRVLAPGHGEIKRMFVSPQVRGTGAGRAILAHIEASARAEGLVRLSLETGIHQPEAIGLYRRAGYVECEPFADYRPDPLSLFMSRSIAPEIAVAIESPLQDDVRTLIGELNATLLALTPAEFCSHMTVEQMAADDTTVLIARDGGLAVGCGALRRHADHIGEVKRMYTRPSHRGLGIGTCILAEVERLARAAGLRRLVLETGDRHFAAWHVYERAGFSRCGPVLDYRDIPSSVFYTKQLD